MNLKRSNIHIFILSDDFMKNMETMRRSPSSGLTLFFVALVAFAIVYMIATLSPIALDKEGSTSINGLFGSDYNSSKSTPSTELILPNFYTDNNSSSSPSVSDTQVSNSSPPASSTSGGANVSTNNLSVYFCPQDECANELVKRIDSAKESMYIAIYSFTQDDIASAVLRAKERGVEIRIVFDYDQSKNDSSVDEKLIEAGIPVKRLDGSGYMHNKFTIIDGSIVSTGSFNYSKNANEKNNENLLFIKNSDLASLYKSDFDLLWEKAAK
jgi:phosphatidylserine/phosphatidylglycerophosphate/cardiolipin synthase-like enzyme